MQAQQHDDRFSAQLEQYEGVDDASGSEPCSGENSAGVGELRRYEEEEIVTEPWPPVRW